MNYIRLCDRKVFTQTALGRLMGLDAANPENLRRCGFLPLLYEAPPRDEWTEELFEDGPPAPAEDGRAFIQRMRAAPLGEAALARKLEERRDLRLEELAAAFDAAQNSGVIESGAAGFPIDATGRANRDIEGLITMLEAKGEASAAFCAADNSFHEVTLAQLKAMRLEIIARGQGLYARKWAIRQAIEAAQSQAELAAVNISFAED